MEKERTDGNEDENDGQIVKEPIVQCAITEGEELGQN